MARLAVIADVHSNLQALEAVAARIEDLHVDGVLCAGDIVGYGARPNECCAMVRELCGLAVYGNHEIAALTGDTIWMNPHAAKAAVWTAKALDQSSRGYLAGLELEARAPLGGSTVAMYHGSVGSAIEYVQEDQADGSLLERAGCDILVLGHTHVPYVLRFRRGLVVNPGSVGQPRDHDPRASFAVLDSDGPGCAIERVAYDTPAAWKDILDAGLPEYLAERLLMGR